MRSATDLIRNIVKKEPAIKGPLRPINAIQEFFSMKPISQEEKKGFFEQLIPLLDDDVEEIDHLKRDVDQLITLSYECSSVQKQGVLLIGEKINEAKKIFASYKMAKPLFTSWIKKTFSSEKTAYNALAFYEFYIAIQEEDLREKLKKMPLKASYILASRKGDIEQKKEIILSSYMEKSDEILLEIQTKIPLHKEDLRRTKSPMFSAFKKIDKILNHLEFHHKNLDSQDKKILLNIQSKIKNLLREDRYDKAL